MQCTINAARPTDVILKLAPGAKTFFLLEGKQWVLTLGYGKKEEMTLRSLRLLVRKAVSLLKSQQQTKVSLTLTEWLFPQLKLNEAECIEMLVTNILLADYAFTRYQTPPKEGFMQLSRVNISAVQSKQTAQSALKRALIIGEETNAARDIANHPASDMTPLHLAKHAKNTFARLPVKVSVWNEKRLAQENMHAILAVGKGSAAKPCLILAEYRGGKKHEVPVVLIGKGVTFDSGGINLKPSTYILGMNMDMSGGATVLHTLAACAKLKVKKNIIALVPAVENMISGESYRPGDIIRTASGKTIEVQDTDAEGRLILSDVLHYAKQLKPALVIDVATLTGSAVVALGERASGLFATDETIETTMRHIGLSAGDPVWPLPLWDEYFEDIKGTYADIGNVGNTKWGGAITAALFLKQFIDYPWVHLDIAPRMTSIPSEHLAKGSIGAGVQLLVQFLLQQKKQ